MEKEITITKEKANISFQKIGNEALANGDLEINIHNKGLIELNTLKYQVSLNNQEVTKKQSVILYQILPKETKTKEIFLAFNTSLKNFKTGENKLEITLFNKDNETIKTINHSIQIGE